MMADSDVQVWLDTAQRVRPGFVVPYVQSEQPLSIRYRIRVVQDSSNGRAVIGQSGALNLLPNVPAAISHFSLVSENDAQCEIEIVLSSRDMKERRYRFDCPV